MPTQTKVSEGEIVGLYCDLFCPVLSLADIAVSGHLSVVALLVRIALLGEACESGGACLFSAIGSAVSNKSCTLHGSTFLFPPTAS
jgi:hypothetical protein